MAVPTDANLLIAACADHQLELLFDIGPKCISICPCNSLNLLKPCPKLHALFPGLPSSQFQGRHILQQLPPSMMDTRITPMVIRSSDSGLRYRCSLRRRR